MSLQQPAGQLNAARTQAGLARTDVLRAGEEVKRLEARLREFDRVFDRQRANDREVKNNLEEQIEQAKARHDEARTREKNARDLLVGLHGTIAPLVDPRAAVGAIPSDLPILMFPLRLETRFSTLQQPGQEKPCLLVRVYPDDVLIDTFEGSLSATEVANARRFWCGWWKAQGDDALRVAYWRDLVAGHGPGRARFAALNYQPLAGSDPKPATAIADVVLAIPSIVPLAAGEKAALNAYTEAIWRAGGDAVEVRRSFEALVAATAPARAAELASAYPAFNANEATPPGHSRADLSLRVRVLHLVFTDPSTLALRNTAWASQPKVDLLPERFVLVLERGADRIEVVGAPVITPLAVGPDPRASRERQYHPIDRGDLHVPEEQRWMMDFENALASGMAFRVILTPQQAEVGFDRLYVLGVCVTSDAEASKSALETLITHQFQSSTGFSLIPQGTPTNRTEGDGEVAVWQGDDGYAAFARVVDGIAAFDPTVADAWLRTDGALFADALGIDPLVVQPITGAEQRDMGEARAMNAALWPATLGYWMDTMMNTVFTDGTIGRTRKFFEEHVTGRGSLPAVRIGKQPYGVLPATAFSRMAFAKQAGTDEDGFAEDLYKKLALLRERLWNSRGEDAAHVGKLTGDPQQLLLDILGLHPAAVEFHQQRAQSLAEFWNRLCLDPAFDGGAWDEAAKLWLAPLLLSELGHNGAIPDLLDMIFTADPILLDGPVIDDRPLSEKDPVRVWTTDGKNYLEWLAEKAATSPDVLRKEEGFQDNTPPGALLYLLLKHALELGLYNASLKLHRAVMEPAALAAMRREKDFVHIDEKPASESRYAALYATDIRITGDPQRTIAEHIVSVLDTAPETQDLKQQTAAVAFLQDLPTARLERLFAEHIDLCTHRLDAWLLGIVHQRLRTMREQRSTGIVLGAYGYVEHLLPKPRPQKQTLDKTTAQRFGAASVDVDPGNGGFIHALSPDHATTAAILRNGHIRNAVPAKPDLFAVDLSSERVRVALDLIEGLRNGQSLGALLGYRFERGLHDRGGSAELDRFIASIRLSFPLVANRMVETAVDDGSVDTIEARNVVNGVTLLEYVNSNAVKTYPWGKDLDRGTAIEEAAIDAELRKIVAANDALADLALAESVHQMARGNTDRAAAAMDMFSKGGFPVQPDVVRTPRGGLALTHRMALHLDPNAAPGATPRSLAEPALNAWLRTVLPPLGDLVLRVGRKEGSAPVAPVAIVSWSDLGLDAIDLLHMLDMHSEQGMNAIDDRVMHRVRQMPGITQDADLRLMYTTAVGGKVTLFEVAPLMESLRELVLGVKPWSPAEAMLPNEAKSDAFSGIVDRAKVQDAWNAMKVVRDEAALLKANIDALPFDPLDFPAIAGAMDAGSNAFISLQKRAGAMGVALSGFGAVIDAKRAWSGAIRSKALEQAPRWAEKLALSAAKFTAAAAAGLNDYARVELLKEAEAAISTVFTRTGTMAPPLTPATFASHVDGLRTAFIAVQAELNAVVTNTDATIAALWSRWDNAVAHMAAHDPTDLQIGKDRTPIVILVQDMSRQLGGMLADLDKRLASAQAQLARSDATAGKEQCDLRVGAAKALFGEDFVILPRYTIAAAQLLEWSNAWNGRAAQLDSARGQGIDHPVDEWLYGVARVRPKAAAWENVLVMSEAFATSTPQLEPVQFPHVPGEPWLALQWPADFDPGSTVDHLLYTACYANGAFDNAATAHCGLLLDEWTEVVPTRDEATSVAFQYDRPGNEAPQTWLLATPASVGPHWTWKDLRATIPDTMALARLRAVEPGAFDDSAIARFLPATIAAVTARRITIGVELARNIKSEKHLNRVLPDA